MLIIKKKEIYQKHELFYYIVMKPGNTEYFFTNNIG
jgi:hypothetical protein